MKLDTFHLERMQSTWEHTVRFNLSESGAEPIALRDLAEMGLDIEQLASQPLGYSQTNGTLELRRALAEHYPGSTADHIQVTNGTSEANFVACLTLLRQGDEVVFESPNYMQVSGIPPALGATVHSFPLRADANWEPDWIALDRLLCSKTRMVYVSNPNNPTGAILSRPAMERIVSAVERVDAFLLADEVYRGAELDGRRTASFWGMSDRVIVTSGLSKAYGIPGVRIGWIVGPPAFVADCWSNHDYISIGPSVLGDTVAQVAVRKDNCERLFARTAEALRDNLTVMREWLDSCDGFFEYVEPRAGAFVFVKYDHPIPSIELAERLRKNQSVLVVPGAHCGMESYLRISLGVPRETLEEGLAHIGRELELLRPSAQTSKLHR